MNKVSGAEEGQYKINWFRSGDNEHALPHNRIRCIYEDRDKDIWIATDGGSARYDVNTGRFVHYAILNATRLKNANWAYDIYEDEKGRFIVLPEGMRTESNWTVGKRDAIRLVK